MPYPRIITLIAICLLGSFCLNSHAQNEQHKKEVEDAYAEMTKTMQAGPADIKLGDQGVLKLPEGYYFASKEPATKLMTAIGNHVGENFYGLVLSNKINGFISVNYHAAGYIKDDDAKDWNAKDLLKGLKEGTEEGNKERRERGIPEFEIVGWVEEPAYDASNHRLVWSASLRDKGRSEADGVNYNTYVLGREGYFSLDLVTDIKTVEAEKPLAKEILASTTFNEGKRYQDFNASTDRIAEYGLAALIAGVAAKKLGLLALIGVFLLKAWKIIMIALVAGGAAVKKFFGGKTRAE